MKVQLKGMRQAKTRIGTVFEYVPIRKPFYVSERNKFFDFYRKSSSYKVLKKFEKEAKCNDTTQES